MYTQQSKSFSASTRLTSHLRPQKMFVHSKNKPPMQSAERTCGDERLKEECNVADFRRVAIEEEQRLMPPMASLGIGAVAGSISALITNPLDVLTTRRILFGRGKPLFPDVNTSFYPPENIAGPLTVREKVARAWQNRVATKLLQGSMARVLSIAPLTAVAFCVYETILVFFAMERYDDDEDNNDW